MSKLKIGQWVSGKGGKINRGSYLEHKGDTGLVKEVKKSKHILDLKHKSKSKALSKLKK